MNGRRPLVFSYGSNLDPERLARRVPSARLVGRSTLPGHDLRFHKRSNHDGLGRADAYATGRVEDVVHGVLHALDPDDLAELDRIEGRGEGYARRLKDFEVIEGVRGGPAPVRETVRAWVYVAQATHVDPTLLPPDWYVRHVVEGARHHGLPGELLERLARVETSG